jgi:hypothetical protein
MKWTPVSTALFFPVNLAASFAVLFHGKDGEVGAYGFAKTAQYTFALVLDLWRMDAPLIELFRDFQHVSGTEFHAKSAAFTPILYYVHFSLGNCDFFRV